MKLLFIIFLLTSSHCFASFVKLSEALDNCNIKRLCYKICGEDYIEIPVGVNCNHSDLKEVVSNSGKSSWVFTHNPEKEAAYKERVRKENDLKNAMEKERGNISFGQNLYAAIKIKNRERGLSKEQRMDLIEELSTIRDLLLAGDLDLALSEVQKIDSETSQVNQEDINYVTSELNKRLGSE